MLSEPTSVLLFRSTLGCLSYVRAILPSAALGGSLEIIPVRKHRLQGQSKMFWSQQVQMNLDWALDSV